MQSSLPLIVRRHEMREVSHVKVATAQIAPMTALTHCYSRLPLTVITIITVFTIQAAIPITVTARQALSRHSPAYAGNTFMSLVRAKGSRVHPRLRGKHHEWVLFDLTDTGSPPLTRETRAGHS